LLDRCLAENGSDYEKAFRSYEALRRVHTDTLADLCLDNFLEMRDRVGSRWFILKKKCVNLLHKLCPRWYLPLYTMIEFTRIPYADAVRRARVQNRMVWSVMLLVFILVLTVIGMVLR